LQLIFILTTLQSQSASFIFAQPDHRTNPCRADDCNDKTKPARWLMMLSILVSGESLKLTIGSNRDTR
jgi:hypothetical protein